VYVWVVSNGSVPSASADGIKRRREEFFIPFADANGTDSLVV